ncbi:glycogen debranching N-terminal domain-containing protein [Nonomuraea salmonea]|uniref:Glycogen debranching N-terminal domain-containing protein n=2 Tax=Nonomuraea salmonea TaxID=46181 RepID=A0ABV5NZR5_9ACTN
MHDHRLQPLLHDLVSTVMAPTTALSGADGQIRPAGVQGLFHADARVLSQAGLLIDGREPEAVAHAVLGPGVSRFVALARRLGDPTPDPTVRIDRVRHVTPGSMSEEITVASTASTPVTCTVTLRLGCDLAPIEAVKSGDTTTPLAPIRPGPPDPSASSSTTSSSVGVEVGEGVVWGDRGIRVWVRADGEMSGETVLWRVAVEPGERVTLRWWVDVRDPEAVVAAPSGAREWSRPQVSADDARLVRLARQSLDDLESLRLTETGAPQDTFLGAGVPWFLTLFGRDSIWAARMLLPLGTDLAAGTLRVLARRQGTKLDPASGEAPGKIMHELRRHEFALHANRLRLPAAYYGTIDATPLWITLLHDAWRWGLPDGEVAALLPAMEAALGWLADHGDADGDGFLEYIDTSGSGLANQGWKDSGDAVRCHDGSRAEPPIALVEVQGYAYEAAMAGAALLDAYGRPGAERWRDYAGRLAERFRAAFWVDGGHPALALDRDKRPVDALTSNIGHLLGTGILTPDEELRIAAVLGDPAMSGAFGLRTMSSGDAGFSPLSYHCGSVWTHDTAIVITALARTALSTQLGGLAAELAEGLLAAAEAFGYRLPELHAGDDRELMGRPVPYPAACRPQAWSAAAAIAILHAATGLYPDVPAGRAVLRPLPGAPLGALSVRGLRVAGASVDVAVDGSGKAQVAGLPQGISLIRG